jgi:hypothetical protein
MRASDCSAMDYVVLNCNWRASYGDSIEFIVIQLSTYMSRVTYMAVELVDGITYRVGTREATTHKDDRLAVEQWMALEPRAKLVVLG